MPETPVSIVTGAGSGIGRAVCGLLAAREHRLVLVGRRETPLEETVAGLGRAEAPVLIVPADVSDQAQARAVIDLTVERWGRIDALVNNAGVLEVAAVEESEESLLFRTFSVNAFGPAYLTAGAWPVLVRQGGGRIVNVSSIATVDPFDGLSAYAASKCALESLTRSISREGAAHGIGAFTVCPGAVETEMLRLVVSEQELPPEQTLAPVEVAEVIVQCVAGERDGENGGVIRVVKE